MNPALAGKGLPRVRQTTGSDLLRPIKARPIARSRLVPFETTSRSFQSLYLLPEWTRNKFATSEVETGLHGAAFCVFDTRCECMFPKH